MYEIDLNNQMINKGRQFSIQNLEDNDAST